MPRIELGPGLVRRTCPPALGLATGAAPFATALLEQHQLGWLRAPRTAATGCWLADLHATWIVTEQDSVNRFRRYLRWVRNATGAHATRRLTWQLRANLAASTSPRASSRHHGRPQRSNEREFPSNR